MREGEWVERTHRSAPSKSIELHNDADAHTFAATLALKPSSVSPRLQLDILALHGLEPPYNGIVGLASVLHELAALGDGSFSALNADAEVFFTLADTSSRIISAAS